MIKTYKEGVYLLNGTQIVESTAPDASARAGVPPAEARRQTMAYSILEKHNTSETMTKLRLKFDVLASHDITYVNIVQTARASGLTEFPMPYVLTNCHNTLCAVGGTINEDDHLFGLSAAKKYGGIFVPSHQAVIHQYMREAMGACGRMILGSDSHTRYGPFGAMGIGEGGPELVKQLLGKTYDISYPDVVAVYLTGTPRLGVGPQDVALTLIKEVFASGLVKNKVLEFVGDGIAALNMDYRIGIDVMTTETTCLSSIWTTDTVVRDYMALHGRPEDYRELRPGKAAYYDGLLYIDLSAIEPMIALPFHPSNAYPIAELQANLGDILREVEKAGTAQIGKPGLALTLTDKIVNGKLRVDQGIIAGCAGGTYDNLCDAADILRQGSIGCDVFSLSIYPPSQPVLARLIETGAVSTFIEAGAIVRSAFCGPCFGAGDVPAHNSLSIRHSTRNFLNREGSKPGNGQIAAVALMDARSIAATALNGGLLTAATELTIPYTKPAYIFNSEIYANRVYNGYGRPQPSVDLRFGPNITDWPVMSPLTDNLLLKVVSVITDPVTTTDELIPSGETSSYRSNPHKLAEFALSRRDPLYVGKAKAVCALEKARLENISPLDPRAAATPEMNAEILEVFARVAQISGAEYKAIDPLTTGLGSLIFANKPGDGSAREQAASCQKVLGGWANIAYEYATKRYRSNLINWGMLPFLLDKNLNPELPFQNGDYIFIPGIRAAVKEGTAAVTAYTVGDPSRSFTLTLGDLTADERQIILDGCLINYYRS